MLLGYHTNSLQNHRFDEAVTLLSDHGYQAIAITPDTCHLDPESITDADLAVIAQRLRDLGIKPVMETGARFLLDSNTKHEPTLMTRDARRRDQRVAFYGRVASMGKQLGADVVSFWAGIDRCPGPDSEAWLLEGVAMACDAIRAAGLVPSLEPEPGMALETFADYERLRTTLGASAPMLTLDIGHLYAVWEGDPAEVVARAAPFLAQVHLEDHRRGVHEHLLPGTGDVDFDGVLRSLSKSSYGGPVCFELSRQSHCAPTAVATCSELWSRFLTASDR